MNVAWTGPRVGGALTTVTQGTQGETFLWVTTKSFIAAATLRAARLMGDDPVARARGAAMYHFLYDGFDTDGRPWDKTTGLQFFLAPAALAYLTNPALQPNSAVAGGMWSRWE